MAANSRSNFFPGINRKQRKFPQNIVNLLTCRSYTMNERLQYNFKKFAEGKAATSSFEETHCNIPTTSRSAFLVSFSRDCSKVASTHGDHNIYISDVHTGEHLKKLEGHQRTPWCLSFHPTSNNILASGCLDGEVRVWDLQGQSAVWRTNSGQVIASLTFHPSLKLLVIALGNSLYFWDWSQPAPSVYCSTSSILERVRFVKFDSYGTKLITGIFNTGLNPPSVASREERAIVFNLGQVIRQQQRLARQRRNLSINGAGPSRFQEVNYRGADKYAFMPTTYASWREKYDAEAFIVISSAESDSDSSSDVEVCIDEPAASFYTPNTIFAMLKRILAICFDYKEHLSASLTFDETPMPDDESISSEHFQTDDLLNPEESVFALLNDVEGVLSANNCNLGSLHVKVQLVLLRISELLERLKTLNNNCHTAFFEEMIERFTNLSARLECADNSLFPTSRSITTRENTKCCTNPSISDSSVIRTSTQFYLESFSHQTASCNLQPEPGQLLTSWSSESLDCQRDRQSAKATENFKELRNAKVRPQQLNHEFSDKPGPSGICMKNAPSTSGETSKIQYASQTSWSSESLDYQNDRQSAKATENFKELRNAKVRPQQLNHEFSDKPGPSGICMKNAPSTSGETSKIQYASQTSWSSESLDYQNDRQSAKATENFKEMRNAKVRPQQFPQKLNHEFSDKPGTSGICMKNAPSTSGETSKIQYASQQSDITRNRPKSNDELNLIFHPSLNEPSTSKSSVSKFSFSPTLIDNRSTSPQQTNWPIYNDSQNVIPEDMSIKKNEENSLNSPIVRTVSPTSAVSSSHDDIVINISSDDSSSDASSVLMLFSNTFTTKASCVPQHSEKGESSHKNFLKSHSTPKLLSESSASNGKSVPHQDFFIENDYMNKSSSNSTVPLKMFLTSSISNAESLPQDQAYVHSPSTFNISNNTFHCDTIHNLESSSDSVIEVDDDSSDSSVVILSPNSNSSDVRRRSQVIVDSLSESSDGSAASLGALSIEELHEFLEDQQTMLPSLVPDLDVVLPPYFGRFSSPPPSGHTHLYPELSDISPLHEQVPQSHRIQMWDFTAYHLPEIHLFDANIVVKKCMIHNDATVDISQDGEKLVALIPHDYSNDFSVLRFGVYSLRKQDLGTCLYACGFISNAISVSFSPLAEYVVAGSSYPVSVFGINYRNRVIHVYRVGSDKPLRESFQNRMADHRNRRFAIHHFARRYAVYSLNCVKWVPHSGLGLAFANNRGAVTICKPFEREIPPAER